MLGGVLGGVAGHAIEKAASKKKGVELIIQMEDGGEIGIQLPKVQAGVYRQGDRVRMMTDRRGKTQVTVVEG
jgi:outer membrane lipoprotein SlyB